MITPLDIQKKQFSKALRGISEKEVQDFMQEVYQTLEKHLDEKVALKEKISAHQEELQRYKILEKTLSETLVVAQRTAEDLLVNSRKEADLLIHKAQLEARAIEEEAKREMQDLHGQRMLLEKEFESFRLRMEGLLRAQLEAVSHYKTDLGSSKGPD